MGTPATTPRGTPAGTKLKDGFPTTVAFAANTTVSFWEKAVTPPGIDGGDPIEQQTMLSTLWREMASRALQTLTPIAATVAYDPVVYNEILSLINTEGAITVHFSNNDSVSFFGYLKSFQPNEETEGSQPDAAIEIVPTNTDPADGTESGPNYVSATGTDQS